MKKNLFICFEGVDCSGKTSACNELAFNLKEQKYNVHKFKLPGDGIDGIRDLILNKDNKYSDISSLLLFCADMNNLVENKIKPLLEEPSSNNIILLDRYFDSTYVYQQVFNKIQEYLLASLRPIVTKNITPDIVFFLDINYKTYLDRKNVRNENLDKFESDIHFYTKFNKMREIYNDIYNKNRNYYKVDQYNILENMVTVLDIFLK